MNEAIVISVGVLWMALLLDFLVELSYNYIFGRKTVTNIWQKGLEGRETSKELFKYLCQLVFDGSAHNINSSNVLTTIELIHTNNKKKKIKLVTITVDFKDIIGQSCVCIPTGFTSSYLIQRLKVLPPITKVRAIHHSPRDPSDIYFKGFEILDQMTGERSFFLVNYLIDDNDMKSATVHSVKPQKLVFFSRQTFCPDFHSIDYEAFGSSVETPANSPEDILKVRLLPKLNWFEVFVFKVFLIHSTFAVMISVLHFLNDEYSEPEVALSSTLAAGMIAPTVTQIIGFTYRSMVRTNYDFNCSPIKVERNESSAFWTMIRFLYLVAFLGISAMLTAIVIIIIGNDFKLDLQQIEKLLKHQTLVVLFLFSVSLLFVYLLWLPIFSIIRFICRLIFFTSLESHEHSANRKKDVKDSIDSDTKSNGSSGGHQKGQESDKSNKKEPSKSLRLRSNLASKGGSGHEDNEENETSEKYAGSYKTDGLNTGSVIVRPTKSLGYIDPDNFKLSESSILSSEPNWQTKKPKNNKK